MATKNGIDWVVYVHGPCDNYWTVNWIASIKSNFPFDCTLTWLVCLSANILAVCLLLFSLGKLLIITSAYTHQINRNWAVCFNLAAMPLCWRSWLSFVPHFICMFRFRHPHKMGLARWYFCVHVTVFKNDGVDMFCGGPFLFFFFFCIVKENNDKLGFIASHQHLYRSLYVMGLFTVHDTGMHLMHN